MTMGILTDTAIRRVHRERLWDDFCRNLDSLEFHFLPRQILASRIYLDMQQVHVAPISNKENLR